MGLFLLGLSILLLVIVIYKVRKDKYKTQQNKKLFNINNDKNHISKDHDQELSQTFENLSYLNNCSIKYNNDQLQSPVKSIFNKNSPVYVNMYSFNSKTASPFYEKEKNNVHYFTPTKNFEKNREKSYFHGQTKDKSTDEQKKIYYANHYKKEYFIEDSAQKDEKNTAFEKLPNENFFAYQMRKIFYSRLFDIEIYKILAIHFVHYFFDNLKNSIIGENYENNSEKSQKFELIPKNSNCEKLEKFYNKMEKINESNRPFSFGPDYHISHNHEKPEALYENIQNEEKNIFIFKQNNIDKNYEDLDDSNIFFKPKNNEKFIYKNDIINQEDSFSNLDSKIRKSNKTNNLINEKYEIFEFSTNKNINYGNGLKKFSKNFQDETNDLRNYPLKTENNQSVNAFYSNREKNVEKSPIKINDAPIEIKTSDIFQINSNQNLYNKMEGLFKEKEGKYPSSIFIQKENLESNIERETPNNIDKSLLKFPSSIKIQEKIENTGFYSTYNKMETFLNDKKPSTLSKKKEENDDNKKNNQKENEDYKFDENISHVSIFKIDEKKDEDEINEKRKGKKKTYAPEDVEDFSNLNQNIKKIDQIQEENESKIKTITKNDIENDNIVKRIDFEKLKSSNVKLDQTDKITDDTKGKSYYLLFNSVKKSSNKENINPKEEINPIKNNFDLINRNAVEEKSIYRFLGEESRKKPDNRNYFDRSIIKKDV